MNGQILEIFIFSVYEGFGKGKSIDYVCRSRYGKHSFYTNSGLILKGEDKKNIDNRQFESRRAAKKYMKKYGITEYVKISVNRSEAIKRGELK